MAAIINAYDVLMEIKLDEIGPKAAALLSQPHTYTH